MTDITIRRATFEEHGKAIHTSFLDYPWIVRTPHVFVTQEAVQDNMGTDLYLIIGEGQDDVGHVCLSHIDPWNRSAEIGVVIWKREMWNCDMACEGLKRVTQMAFESMGLERVWARPAAWNSMSIAAGKRADFKYEGRTVKSVFHAGKLVDELIFGITKEG